MYPNVDFQKSEVLESVKHLDIPIIDIHELVFKNHPDPLSLFPFRLHRHYTAAGYRRVAETMLMEIKKTNSVDAN